MEGSESPRLVFNPRPAPGANVDPVTEAIRSPSHNDRARTPAGAVAGDITPVAVFVEILVAGHLAGNIVRRIGVIFVIVALESTGIEIIAVGKLSDVILKVIAAGECRGLIGNHCIGKSAAGDAAAAVPDGG